MRILSIDILRGLAATSVVAAHVQPRFAVGAIGVDVFFVISGFVMAHASEKRSPRQFLEDRFWRIFPMYWAVAIPWIGLALIAGAVQWNVAVFSLLLVPQWIGLDASFIGVSWTLVFELMFYVLVALAMRLRSPTVPLLIFGCALFARPLVNSPFFTVLGHPIAIEFLFGSAIAHLRKLPVAGITGIAAAVSWLAFSPNSHLHDFLGDSSSSYGFTRVAFWGVPAALLVYGLVSLEDRINAAAVRPLLLLGASSYSIYLFHTIVLGFVEGGPVTEFTVAISTGVVAWYLVERKILGWRARSRAHDRSQITTIEISPSAAEPVHACAAIKS